MATIINSNDFAEKVLQADKKVLVDFFAPWCGPCQALSPTIDEVAEENDDIAVYKVDIDQSPELATEYGVMSIPSLKVFKDGEIIAEHLGMIGKEDLMKLL